MDSTKENSNIDDCITIDEDLWGCTDLTEFYSEEQSSKDKEIQDKIDSAKWFYLKNQQYDYISLKKGVYDKYKSDVKFLGIQFTKMFDTEDDMIILLTQYVNEKREMKRLGKMLFYRELYLSTCKNKSVNQLFKKYIGETEQLFIFDCKNLVDNYRWCFLVHKNRLVYIKNRINSLVVDSDDLNLKSIKSYDDVFNYFKNKIN